MKSLKIIARATLFLTLCSLWALAQESDSSLINKQKETLETLDSLEKNSLGFALNGRAKSGISASIVSSEEQIGEESNRNRAQSEYSAFTDFLLSISVRPSAETRALFDLRFHKDWQSAYREGNNLPVITWWSYDGLILDKKLKFNLGTMRVAYTPLTIAAPSPDLIFEPQIFADKRTETMADRYIDNSGKRLMQGLNAEFNMPAGFIDNIFVQATIARLRNNAKKADQIFYDFDRSHDSYATAARLGVEAFGVKLGVNDVYSFDRVSSNRAKTRADSANYEYNNVLSFNGGINSKKWFSGSLSFGANAELAISNWMHYKDVWKQKQDTVPMLGTPDYLIPCTNCPDSSGSFYPYYDGSSQSRYLSFGLSKVEDWHNQAALLADAFVTYAEGTLETKLSGHYLKTDKGFEAELAASPSYLPIMPILNSNAAFDNDIFGQFRSGSLESMYYSLYYALPQNAASQTFMSQTDGSPANPWTSIENKNNWFNNYKFGHYYRNAYNFRTYTRLERDSIAGNLDPSVNMALPFGYATPDRQGGDADLSVNWNDAVMFRGVFGMYASDSTGDYTRLGGGLSMRVERLVSLPKPINVSGSFEQNKQDGGLDMETTRIMAGFNAGIWRGLSLLGGVQLLDKKFGASYGGVKKTSETLLLGGPDIKISERSHFVVQAGLLSNSINGEITIEDEDSNITKSNMKLDVNKYVFSGMVNVGF